MMTVFKMDFLSKRYTNSVQSAFCRLRLKDYFELLDEIDDSIYYRSQYKQIKEYTRLDEYCGYDFYAQEKVPYREDVTVGEMLYAASEMFRESDKLRSSNFDGDCDDGSMQEAAGRTIVLAILIYPLSDQKIIDYIEQHINDESKGD